MGRAAGEHIYVCTLPVEGSHHEILEFPGNPYHDSNLLIGTFLKAHSSLCGVAFQLAGLARRPQLKSSLHAAIPVERHLTDGLSYNSFKVLNCTNAGPYHDIEPLITKTINIGSVVQYGSPLSNKLRHGVQNDHLCLPLSVRKSRTASTSGWRPDLFVRVTSLSDSCLSCPGLCFLVASMPVPLTDAIVVGGLNPVEGKIVSVPSHQAINEKVSIDESGVGKELASEIQAIPATTPSDDGNHEKDDNSDNAIIITGADAARYLLPLRDDFDPALTFRSMFLATCLSAFQAVMSQIYTVSFFLG